jgi:PhzF family phenazine biosynthesis protein
MRRRFFTLDVFTQQRFAGNPLAVVLEPTGLGTEAMQAIAREFNLPETVFVLPPANSKHRARLRIFTPARELPFAGHPTVGTRYCSRISTAGPPSATWCWERRSDLFRVMSGPARTPDSRASSFPVSPSGWAPRAIRTSLPRP